MAVPRNLTAKATVANFDFHSNGKTAALALVNGKIKMYVLVELFTFVLDGNLNLQI